MEMERTELYLIAETTEVTLLPSDVDKATEILDETIAELSWTISHYLRAIIFCTIIIATLFGNALVIISVLIRHRLRSPTNFFIANLAFADILVGILVLPVLATFQLTEKWYFGQDYCIAWVCIHFWLCAASILSICAICLDRYLGVRHPLKHYRYMNTRRVAMIIGLVWVLSGGLSVIPVFAWPEPQSDEPYQCKLNNQFGHVLVASIGILYIPTFVMVILYWQIYRAAVNHLSSIQKGFKKNNGNGHLRIHVGNGGYDSRGSTSSVIESDDGRSSSCSGPNKGENNSSSSSTPKSSLENLTAINFRRQSKTAKKLAVVVGAFILSYVPFFTMFLIRSRDVQLVPDEVFNVFGWIRYFNSCLNPMIYAAMLPAFRKTFTEIIFCKKNR